MQQKIFFIFLLSFPSFLYAQLNTSLCDHIYIKMQHLPALKVSNEVYSDSLVTILKSKNFSLKNNEITCRFIVTSNAQIEDIIILLGTVTKQNEFNESILSLGAFWQPATQNGYAVCAYTKLHIKIINKKILVDIPD